MLLEENFKFVNQMLHYTVAINSTILFHSFCFMITVTLFLFKTPKMFCKCVILPLSFEKLGIKSEFLFSGLILYVIKPQTQFQILWQNRKVESHCR